MTIVVVGLNYRTAPVEIREKLTLSGLALQQALHDLSGHYNDNGNGSAHAPEIDEAVILSTCNRLEIYACAQQAEAGITHIEHFLANSQNIPLLELKQHLQRCVGDEAILHLMRVASGLDSMILGESQILGQVTQAFEDARKAGMTGPILSHLFSQAIHTGKRARSETPISRNTTSVSHAGALLLMEKLQDLPGARMLVIGAGEMAVLAAQAVKRYGIDDIAFINRTYSRAETLAREFGGQPLSWGQLEEALVWADAIICATGAPHTVIYRHELQQVIEQRSGRSLVIMDIAVPRDVEDSVRELPGVQCYDIDDLQSVVDSNIELRQAAIPDVESIIEQEMQRFIEWYHSRQVTPVIKDLRQWAQSIAEEELIQTLNRLNDTDDRTRQVVSRLAHRLVNRLLHEPTSRLRIQAHEGNGYGYAHAIRELFSLQALEDEPCQSDHPACTSYGQADANSQHCNLQCILPYSSQQQVSHDA